MSLRLRLIVAFFLFSVVPLVAVTFYSYTSNERALQVAAQHEAEMLTGELTQRMQVVTNQISERVEHLMDMPVAAQATAGTSGRSGTRAAQTVTARAAHPASPAVTAPAAPAAPASPASVATAIDPTTMEGQVAASLGEVAMLLNNVEVRGMGRGGARGGPFQGPSGNAGIGPGGAAVSAEPNATSRGGTFPRPPFPADRSNAQGRGHVDFGREGPPTAPAPAPAATATGLEAQPNPGREGDGRRGRGRFRPDGPRPDGLPGIPTPPVTPPGERAIPPPSGAGIPTPPGTPPVAQDDSDPSHMKLDLTPIRRELFREMAPNGSFEQMTPEERARVGREVNQRLLGIVQGIQLGAAELQKKADAAQKQAAAVSGRQSSVIAGQGTTPQAPAAPNVLPAPGAPSAAAPPGAPAVASGVPATGRTSAAPGAPPSSRATAPAATEPPAPPKPMTRKAALTGTRLDVRVMRNGEVVQQVNAEINLPNLLATVFANTRRDSGEIPFAVGKDGHLYAPTEADRAKLSTLDVSRVDDTPGTKRLDNWVVVTMPDRSGAGLRFGIARPVGNLLNDLRRTTARNAGFGLLFIGIALVGIVPLSGRLTRNLSSLTDGVGRIAKGDYAARVPVKSGDEIGRLAAAFNQMAADVEQHQRSAVEQERIRRELELGRRIQSEMLPSAPLHFGLTEVKGVSVPAREVGGDFFNYFALDSGLVALLVGDVSGKGVGAALLMANIQASLRTRFALGQGLSAIAEAIDRDIEANSPGPVYATLFIAIFDPATRRMRYVNAGHNPQFVLRGAGGLEKMWSTGLPVGMLAGRGYKEMEVHLAPGDLLFFYTDGCVEMENENGDMFGTERLEALVAESVRGSADEVLANVEHAISTFRGGRDLFDDATMMAVTVG